MACYIDTSALVALCLKEPTSDDVTRWYRQCKDRLVASVWCVTEFASALGIKQRTGQITSAQAHAAWLRFERLCSNDLQLLPVDSATFHRAALLSMDAGTGLRAGDALHLAAALDAKVKQILTLDDVFARNAKKMKIELIEI